MTTQVEKRIEETLKLQTKIKAFEYFKLKHKNFETYSTQRFNCLLFRLCLESYTIPNKPNCLNGQSSLFYIFDKFGYSKNKLPLEYDLNEVRYASHFLTDYNNQSQRDSVKEFLTEFDERLMSFIDECLVSMYSKGIIQDEDIIKKDTFDKTIGVNSIRVLSEYFSDCKNIELELQ